MTNRAVRLAVAGVAGGLLAVGALAPPAVADSIRDRQWHLDALDVTRAHQHARGAGVTVAVIDTGVNADHRDLTRNVLPGLDLTGEPTRGHRDTDGHGTGMAGLIAAHGHGRGNADGALGIAPAAKILPIRDGRTRDNISEHLPAAIDQAVDLGADVISLSLVGPASTALRTAINQAIAANVVVVAAAGNRPEDTAIGYPAAYPGVIAVGATAADGQLADITVTGHAMTLTAPGVDIVSTSRTGGYRSATGTSEATAIVAGAAALVRSRFPDLTATEVVHRLTATARDRGSAGHDPQYGHGTLDLVAALTADVPPPDASPAPGTAPGGTTDPSPLAAAPPGGGQTPLKLSPVFYLTVAALILALLTAVALATWLLIRSRNRRRAVPAGYPAGHPTLGQSPPGHVPRSAQPYPVAPPLPPPFPGPPPGPGPAGPARGPTNPSNR